MKGLLQLPLQCQRQKVLSQALPHKAALRLHILRYVPSSYALGGIIDCVEGQPVRVEEHGVDGMPGYYRRVIVTCPWHTGHGQQPCRLRRNTGHRQTAALGMKEPLAYLGAWLVAGSKFSSREDHARFQTQCHTNSGVCYV